MPLTNENGWTSYEVAGPMSDEDPTSINDQNTWPHGKVSLPADVVSESAWSAPEDSAWSSGMTADASGGPGQVDSADDIPDFIGPPVPAPDSASDHVVVQLAGLDYSAELTPWIYGTW